MDFIFSVSQVIEKTENLTSPHILFSLILKKPLTLWTEKLWNVMLNKGIPTNLITIIQKIYTYIYIYMYGKNYELMQLMEYRKITQGLRKECPLSPVLFNLYLDEDMIWLQKLNTSKYFKELNFISFFADDQFIICDTKDNLQKAVYLLYNMSKAYNLEIAIKRRKYLVSL